MGTPYVTVADTAAGVPAMVHLLAMILGAPRPPWLTQCKQAKAKYRQHFEELREVRSDADYTATLIESTRAQLLADFDAWLQARSLVITPSPLSPT